MGETIKEQDVDQEVKEVVEQEPSTSQKDSDYINDRVKGAIEALLFVSERPLSLDQLRSILKTVGGMEIKVAIRDLQQDYETRSAGLTILELAGGYQMLSNSIYATYIKDFFKTKHKERLSKPALESLAIIAYKQPVTRADIEIIRGVNSDGVAGSLLSKDLIKVVGRKDVPGKPFMYGTTKQFLQYFGLKSLSDLPKLEEFPSLMEAEDNQEYLETDALNPTENTQTEDVQEEAVASVELIEDIEPKRDEQKEASDSQEEAQENPVVTKAAEFLQEAEGSYDDTEEKKEDNESN